MNESTLEPGPTVVSRQEIARRLPALAAEITAALGQDVDGLVVMPVLTGALMFAADLMRCFPQRLSVELITARSYGAGTISQGPKIFGEVPHGVRGRPVLILDDIIDSGRTISLLRKCVMESGAKSVRTCVLLRKQLPEALATPCEFVGFDIPDLFVAGYGLDCGGRFRNLPDVVALHQAGKTNNIVR